MAKVVLLTIWNDHSCAQAKLQKLRMSASGTAPLPHFDRPWSAEVTPALASDFLEPRRRGWADVRRPLPSLETQPMHARSQVRTPRFAPCTLPLAVAAYDPS